MLFNTLEFAGFVAVVFAAYWAVKGLRAQNVLLLVASYAFYAYWDWRFLLILAGISAVAHVGSRLASAGPRGRGQCGVWLVCLVGLGALGLFKYYDFFANSFAAVSSAFGLHWSPAMLRLGLPMGISFFTFKAISYVVDCYRGKLSPARSWVDSFLYVGFFPQLAAGPIDRASHWTEMFQGRTNLAALVKSLQSIPNVTVLDYFGSPRFSDDDFVDPTHLNIVGARKFSSMLKVGK